MCAELEEAVAAYTIRAAEKLRGRGASRFLPTQTRSNRTSPNTPRKYASGEIDRNGSITKAGDGAVREALVQAALTLLTRVQRWSVLQGLGVAIAKRRGLRRVIVAVARKLAIVMHRIWIDGTTFNWSREAVAAA
jgi:transposase